MEAQEHRCRARSSCKRSITGAGWGAGAARAAAVPCPLTACLPHPPPLAGSSPRYSHTVAHTVAHMPTMDAKRQLPERNYKHLERS